MIGIAAACVPIGSTAAYAMDTPHHPSDWGGGDGFDAGGGGFDGGGGGFDAGGGGYRTVW
uniref:Uncharacterized protein n=1 Tax=Thermocrispum agreste TaxID=37925 RepID=A0A2W4JG87_9PSEU|nr:MAG: hypothetical protein DIU77_08475 [Thermocrispum agreste]